MRPKTAPALALPIAALIAAACGTPRPAPQAAPAPAEPEIARPAPEAGPTGPVTVAIGALQPNPDREVRVKGVVSRVLGMRLVPPKVIFQLTDDSGSVTAVINEKAQLSEGTTLELVGRYHSVPSPMHSGPGTPPQEPTFVVDRYLDL